MNIVHFRLLSSEGRIPSKGSAGAAGYDLCSAENCIIFPYSTVKINTDLAIICPPNTYCRIVDRSSLAYKKQLHVIGGVVDPDYRGNIQVVLHNLGANINFIHKGERFAQIIFENFTDVIFEEKFEEFSLTSRGNNGFGSSDNSN